jgi:hypothetical protein
LRESAVVNVASISIEKQAALDIWREERLQYINAIANSSGLIRNTREDIAALSGNSDNHASNEERLEQLRLFGGHHFSDLFVIEPIQGMVVSSVGGKATGKFKEDRPYFINGKYGPYVQNAYYSIELEGPAITFTAPIRAPEGNLLGVLEARDNLSEINGIVTRSSGLYENEDDFIVDNASLLLTKPRFIGDAESHQGAYTPRQSTVVCHLTAERFRPSATGEFPRLPRTAGCLKAAFTWL